MICWKIHHRAETGSTNLDAHTGRHGDVFTADFQTAGRGRLDHKWLSPPGTNLMMSVVLSVEGLTPEIVATFPLAVGLAVVQAVRGLLPDIAAHEVLLKWPNDVLIGGRKVAGILCERHLDHVIVGIGVNVRQRTFAPEIEGKAISLGAVSGFEGAVPTVRDAILMTLERVYRIWQTQGFDAVYPKVRAIDLLRGQTLAVRQTDDDSMPLRGLCGGIQRDGSLLVGGTKVYAGEAHVEEIG
mgnify:CR=1 FL=1